MLAIVGGLVAAFAWGTATLAASRATAVLGSRVVLAWVMLIGLVISVPIVLARPVPPLDGEAALLLAVSGFGNVLGLLAAYSAFATGKVSVVAPITSTEGAAAALIAIVLGETVGLPVLVALGVAALGVVLVSWERETDAADATLPLGDPAIVAVRDPDASATGLRRRLTGATGTRRAVLLAMLAAGLFAVGLYATGRIGAELGVGLTVLPSRLIGVVFVTIPLALRRRLWLTRRTLPLVLLMGVLEVIGVVGIAIGSSDAIAITVVVSSQFAAVAVIAAFLVFGERLRRHQVVGIGLIAVGVAGVALARSVG